MKVVSDLSSHSWKESGYELEGKDIFFFFYRAGLRSHWKELWFHKTESGTSSVSPLHRFPPVSHVTSIFDHFQIQSSAPGKQFSAFPVSSVLFSPLALRILFLHSEAGADRIWGAPLLAADVFLCRLPSCALLLLQVVMRNHLPPPQPQSDS